MDPVLTDQLTNDDVLELCERVQKSMAEVCFSIFNFLTNFLSVIHIKNQISENKFLFKLRSTKLWAKMRTKWCKRGRPAEPPSMSATINEKWLTKKLLWKSKPLSSPHLLVFTCRTHPTIHTHHTFLFVLPTFNRFPHPSI